MSSHPKHTNIIGFIIKCIYFVDRGTKACLDDNNLPIKSGLGFNYYCVYSKIMMVHVLSSPDIFITLFLLAFNVLNTAILVKHM